MIATANGENGCRKLTLAAQKYLGDDGRLRFCWALEFWSIILIASIFLFRGMRWKLRLEFPR